MKFKKLAVVASMVAVAGLFATVLAMRASAQEVPPPPEDTELVPDKFVEWQLLRFDREIPAEWGTVVSINRAQRGGECYTLWFLDSEGTLRGITTRSFTGPNRGTFFPEVYEVRRKAAAGQTPVIQTSPLPMPDRPAGRDTSTLPPVEQPPSASGQGEKGK